MNGLRIFTVSELSRFDGEQDKRIYVALLGKVRRRGKVVSPVCAYYAPTDTHSLSHTHTLTRVCGEVLQ